MLSFGLQKINRTLFLSSKANILRGLQVRKKVPLMFLRQKHNIKGKCYVLRAYNSRNKVCFVYLERQLQQHRYGLCIFKIKCQKTVETTYLDTSKEETRRR